DKSGCGGWRLPSQPSSISHPIELYAEELMTDPVGEVLDDASFPRPLDDLALKPPRSARRSGNASGEFPRPIHRGVPRQYLVHQSPVEGLGRGNPLRQVHRVCRSLETEELLEHDVTTIPGGSSTPEVMVEEVGIVGAER